MYKASAKGYGNTEILRIEPGELKIGKGQTNMYGYIGSYDMGGKIQSDLEVIKRKKLYCNLGTWS